MRWNMWDYLMLIKLNMEFKDIDGLYNVLKHGDEDHKEWLKETIQIYYENTSGVRGPYSELIYPEVRGSGNKDKLIKELQEEIEKLKK